jgi:Ca2+-dependent lipid-binding protein
LTNISNLNKSESLLTINTLRTTTMSHNQLDLPKQESNVPLSSKHNLGRLNFSIAYLSSVQQLKIHLKNAIGLPARDANGLSDPYVKCHLLPGVAKSTKLRSKTIYKNLDPIFDEILVYEGISMADIDSKILRLTVLDEDKIGFDYIGEYRIPLKELKIDEVNSFEADLEEIREVRTKKEIFFFKLNNKTKFNLKVNEEEDRKMRGKINIGLKYCTSTKTLFVKIIKCVQLIPMDGGKSSDPFVEM